MKHAYRMFKRRTRPHFYIQNNSTGEQRSLGTADRKQAQRLLDAENDARENPALNLQLGTVYLTHADPEMGTRTWQAAMDELRSHGGETTRARYDRALRAREFDLIRNRPIIQTTAEELKIVLKRGGSATNNILRRLHNLALGNGWIAHQIIPAKQWEKCSKRPKRAITLEEHRNIIAAESNPERRLYYEMLWQIGAAQTDGSLLRAENVDWGKRVLSFCRKKTGERCHLQIGAALEQLLRKLPSSGFLFPRMASLKDKDRSAEFSRRCRLLRIEGVSLHSYRYAWAERAYQAGYPERYAQAALGHKTQAVHHCYARNAQVVCPPLEDGGDKIIPIQRAFARQ